jgi:formylglycine-generating enzyme required for sulfatase activity
MIDRKKDHKLFLNLVEFVKDNSTKSIEARKKYALAGIQLTYEKVWFTGNFDVDKFKVSGRDWEVVIALHKGQKVMPTGGRVPPALMNVWWEGVSRPLVGIEVANREAIDRDLTLLRMFGIEHIFAGR